MPASREGDVRISCIIPCLNEAGTIRTCLAQFDRLPGCWELIVADSASTDGTRKIASSFQGVRIVDAPPGRGAGMNAGAAKATGEVLLFLHADTVLPVDAWQFIVRAMEDEQTSATAFHLRLDRREFQYRLVEIASRIRIPVQRTFFGDQAIAVRRRDFEEIGGYRNQLLMEDVDLSLRLRKLGKLRILPAHVTTSARRFQRFGVLRTLAMMTGFQIAYSLGVPADRIARWYAAVR